MTADGRTCPSCGRQVPDTHTLCIKCGARLDDPSALTGPVTRLSARARLRLIAFGVALAVIAGLAGLFWRLTADAPDRPARRPTQPHTVTDEKPPARPAPDPRPTPRATPRPPVAPRSPGPKPRSPSTFPLHPPPGADAGVSARPAPRLAPAPKSARPGVLAGLRRCVDASRKRAEADCADIRRYLGHTAESACLWSKIFKQYWTCIKHKTQHLTGCVAGCAARGARCATGCVAQAERKAGESTGGCLLRCWRKRIDPCLGKCTRP